MIKDLKKAKDKVEKILKEHPGTRDSDKLLWLAYLAIYHDLRNKLGPVAYESFKAILLSDETVTMESIRRMRQKFQEGGNYIGTKRKFKLAEERNVREEIKNLI